jgi:hypothetical protein
VGRTFVQTTSNSLCSDWAQKDNTSVTSSTYLIAANIFPLSWLPQLIFLLRTSPTLDSSSFHRVVRSQRARPRPLPHLSAAPATRRSPAPLCRDHPRRAPSRTAPRPNLTPHCGSIPSCVGRPLPRPRTPRLLQLRRALCHQKEVASHCSHIPMT